MPHHARYKIQHKPCRDQRFYNFLRQAVAFLEGTHMKYAAFGSVAVCTWLPFAPFLPKDLDVIVDESSWQHLKMACWEWDLPLRQEKHFASIEFGHYELNVVPEHCRIFPWRSDKVVASYDLTLSTLELSQRDMRMLPINTAISFVVPRPEHLLVSGMRVIGFNSDAMHRALLLLEAQEMNVVRLFDFLDRCEGVTQRFSEKLTEIETLLSPYGHPALAQIQRINHALREHTNS